MSSRIAFVINGQAEDLRAGKNNAFEVQRVLCAPDLGCCTAFRDEPLTDIDDPYAFLRSIDLLLASWELDDELVLYYSGHGRVEANTYEIAFSSQWLPFNFVTQKLAQRVQRGVIVLDACRSGSALRSMTDNDRIDSSLVELNPPGFATLTSSRANELSWELEDGSFSVFASLFCQGIETGLGKIPTTDGNIEVSELIGYINGRLSEDEYVQYPQKAVCTIDEAVGRICIARNREGESNKAGQIADKNKSCPDTDNSIARSTEEWDFIAKSTDNLDKPCESCRLDDLDWELIQEFAESAKAPWNTDDSRVEKARKLRLVATLPSADDTPPRRNSVLCFASAPHEFVVGAECRIFYGDVGDPELISDTITGPISRQIIEATERVVLHMKGRASFSTGPRRVQATEIPEEVVRELLSNALIHRDYESASSVDIHFTANELVFTSPGLFPDSPNWNDYLEHNLQSNPRNPKLVRFMRALGVFEKYGRGFQVFKKFMALNGPSSITCTPIAGPATRITVTRPLIRYADEPRKHVFISYSRDNLKDVVRLRDDLIAAGETVWWDQDILAGHDWKYETRSAMRDSYAVIVCLSSATANRLDSHIYAEMQDAMATYKEGSSSDVLLIPVRLDQCEIPTVGIDATRTLDRLQYIDLFPTETREEGITRLLQALRSAPHHPATSASTLVNPTRRGSMPSPSDSPRRFVHRLLRARDWQDRPEFREVCDWWSHSGNGVLALVGIGGSGKTAIAERFLQVVPGGYPEHPKVPKDADLPALGRVFVFSFYDAPNPDSFVAELGTWLRAPGTDGEAQQTTLSYHQLLQLLPSAGQCLLILDGLEKVQDDGSRGGAFGQINDGRLRDFVLRVSDALVPDVSVLITSRFRLYDPLAHRTDCYREVDVEQLEPDAAVKLLRDRGVGKGTRRQLEDIAREQGFHALSVDLTGGYIARFCDGDATQLSAFESLDLSDLDPHKNSADRAIVEQERRFIRLAERYEEVLAESDPAALALLQRVCLFRLGIDVDTVAAIFTGDGKSRISGRALSKLKKSGVRSKMKLLASMGLVEASATRADEPEERTVYTIHPAVRDGFRSSLDRETALASHDAAREGIEALLGEQIGDEEPSDNETLDLLEELIYHAISSGHTDEAWEIYKSRIGGHQNLGFRLGQFDRGERICRAFENTDATETFKRDDWLKQFGFYHTHLGDLTQAAAVFRQQNPDDVNMAPGTPDLTSVLIARGHLMDGDNVVETSSVLYEENRAAYRGRVSALQGRVEAALEFFEAADGGEGSLHSDYAIWHCGLLSRLDRASTARRLTELHRDELLNEFGPAMSYVHECRLLLAELSLRRGDAEDAADELQQACDWALARDAKELLCWSAMFRGRLELARFGEDGGARSDSLQQAAVATEEGLRIARDCGYAIFHVDLLLQQARVNLLRGLPESALADVSLAVEDGLPADEVTGRPDMPAASDKRFGYAWGIVEGLHLRGEAQLLQAAGRLGSTTYTPRSRATPAEVRELIAEGKRNLERAMRRWKKLRDPEPREDNNFVHPETGEEYNYRAAETYDVLKALSEGVLTTRYTLQPISTIGAAANVTTTRDQVFISYSHKDTQYCEELCKHLKIYLRNATFKAWSDQAFKPSAKWYDEIQDALARTKVAVFLVSVDFLASEFIWDKELKPLLDEAEKKNIDVLWVPLRPSLVDETPLAQYQAVGNPKNPLAAMPDADRDAAWVDVCKVIKDTINP